MQLILRDGNNGFHQRDRRGQSGDQNQQEKRCADHVAEGHGFKYTGQRYEHQAGPGVDRRRIAAIKGNHGRYDHQTGDQGNTGVENFNLPDRTLQMIFCMHIRAIGDHDAHGQ